MGGTSNATSNGGTARINMPIRIVTGSPASAATPSSASTTASPGTSASSDPPASTNGLPLGSPGNPYTTQVNNGGTQTIRNTPEIVAPNISGGNPCLVGISAGGSGPGFGLTFGIGYADKGCERRNSAALLNNIGERTAAVALMCQDESVARA